MSRSIPFLNSSNPVYAQVLRDFNRWSKDQKFIHEPGMVGQTETHLPCKAAYAVAVFDHDQGRWSHLRVMVPAGGRIDWRVIGLA